jgi:hypothetical protein
MEPIMAGLDLMPVLNEVMMYAMYGAMGMVMWGIKAFIKKIGFEADATQIARVEAALSNGLRFGKDELMKKAKEAGMNDVEIKNQMAMVAAQYAVSQVPGAAKAMGYSPEQLKDWASTIMSKPENGGQ